MIAALAGRRIDAADAETIRFPLENTDLVRGRVLELFEKNSVKALISSAACGADLLALDAAGELKLRRYIILPFERERFRETSVTDRPGNWGEMFDKICDEVEREGNLIVLENFQDDAEAYSAATGEILRKASSLQGEEVLAVIIWEGKAKDEKDETAAFAEKARAINFRVEEVLTK
jgi:hypothetical protein